MFASHLLCHADYAGYYIPVDFADPLFLPEEAKIGGAGMVGSSQQLLAELRELRARDRHRASTKPATRRRTQAPRRRRRTTRSTPRSSHGRSCIGRALASIESGHAIVFC